MAHEKNPQAKDSASAQPKAEPHNPGHTSPEAGQPSTQGLATPAAGGQLETMDVNAMLLADEGVGREHMTARDIAIPRLSILQALSPVCTKADPAYIKGAEVGEIYDNIHSKRWPGEKGLIIIPVTYRSTYLEWRPKKLGGGFIGDRGPDPVELQTVTRGEKGENILPNGNTLVLTAEYFCIMIDPDTSMPRQVVISMANTQFKKAKLLNAMISNLVIPRPDGKGTFNPAMFYKSYKFTTVPESNDQGSWFGWKIEMGEDTLKLAEGLQIYVGSRTFRQQVASGDVKVADPESMSNHQPNDIDSETI